MRVRGAVVGVRALDRLPRRVRVRVHAAMIVRVPMPMRMAVPVLRPVRHQVFVLMLV